MPIHGDGEECILPKLRLHLSQRLAQLSSAAKRKVLLCFKARFFVFFCSCNFVKLSTKVTSADLSVITSLI